MNPRHLAPSEENPEDATYLSLDSPLWLPPLRCGIDGPEVYETRDGPGSYQCGGVWLQCIHDMSREAMEC